jgi:hypothetical protein
MLEHDETPYFANTSTANSTGSYEGYCWPPAEIYPPTISTLPPQNGCLDFCHPAPQSTTSSFAHGFQTSEPAQHYPSRSLEPWAPSHSGNARDPTVAGPFWGYSTNMDASATTVSISGDTRWIPKTEIAVPMPGDQSYKLHEMVPPPEVARDSSFITEDRQYPYEGGTVPDVIPEATVEQFPFQHTPVQSVIPKSTAPADSLESDPWILDLASQNTSDNSVKTEDGRTGGPMVKQKEDEYSSAQAGVSKKHPLELNRTVAGRVKGTNKKHSRDVPSKACDECRRRKIKCGGKTHYGRCKRCHKAQLNCTWHKLNAPVEFKFKHYRQE